MMAGCPAWNYSGVSAQVFKSLQAMGKKEGFVVPSTPTGSFSLNAGIVKVGFKYAWNQAKGTLSLQCTSKPPMLSCQMLKSMADSIVTRAGGRA